VSSMTDRERNAVQQFHTAADYVWAEIRYLDSRTDYRECLPENGPPESRPWAEPLIFLDDESSYIPWNSFAKLTGSTLVLILVILMLRG